MKNTILMVGNRLRRCILNRDKELWSKIIMIKDDVAAQSINKWFYDYFVIHRARNCNIKLTNIDLKKNIYYCRFLINVYYYDDKIYDADLLIHIKKEEGEGKFKIVNIEKYHNASSIMTLPWHIKIKKNKFWWDDLQSEKIFTSKETICLNDYQSYQKMARAITRNIRFREAHIQLECASIITCMISDVMYTICQKLKFSIANSEQKLKYVYNILLDKFCLQVIRPDRDNTWASKYLAPWYGIEEIIAGRKDKERINVNCNFFMSTLYSLLRLSGFNVRQLFQFRIINQDYLIVWTDENKIFFISHDNLTLCNKNTIYPSGKVNRIFGAEWFIDFKNSNVEASPELIQSYNYIAKKTFLPIYTIKGNEKMVMMNLPCPLDLRDFRYKFFNQIKTDGSSIYPWIKYVNQTLYVNSPETYVYWSIQSNWGNVVFKKDKEIFHYIKRIGNKSIFSEPDRIMTSDQIIRHQTGDRKSCAVFIFSALKKYFGAIGYIIFTKKYEYVIYRYDEKEKWNIFNVSFGRVDKYLKGEIVLIFNNRDSYYPIFSSNKTLPSWLKEIC